MEKPVSEPEGPPSESVDAKAVPVIRYEESSELRVFHCHGAIGGPTPQGFFGMSLYAERYSLPDKAVPEVDSEGNVTERLEGKVEIVRRVEATVLLTLDEAGSLGRWLLDRAQQLKGNE